VGIIYRKDIVTILTHNSWIPKDYNKEKFNTRSVLYVKCVILGDTVHLLINHWPSRLGGTLANEDLRTAISDLVREKADSINFNSNGKARVVIMGDFNCTWDDKEMRILTDSALNNNNTDLFQFINLSKKLAKKGIGSYRYQGIWEMIDQVIVSDYLINCEKGLYTNEDYFEVFDPGFLLKRDSKFPGYTPYSTFIGYRYQEGYSDHLPVLLELRIK
jgi:endonuclease/exonuclease/phosphatase family metal-dependent hydrolase